MGKYPEQAFLQRRYTYSQKGDEKVFKIISLQGSANQTIMRYRFTPAKITIIKKDGQ